MLLREHIKTPLSNNRLQPRYEKNPTPFIYNMPEPEARKAERYQLLWLTGKQFHSAKILTFLILVYSV